MSSSPASPNPETLLLEVLRHSSQPLTADELVSRARDTHRLSSSDTLSAAWHLVGKGMARFTEDHRLVQVS
jgi:hypothetical protein